MMTPVIIATGSSGNATFIHEYGILIDCGVSRAVLAAYMKQIRLVLLTHRHSDHFNTRTISYIAKHRPTVRFGCGVFLVPKLTDLGVNPANIDIVRADREYRYGKFTVTPVQLTHDVPNIGYKLCECEGHRLIYATDTSDMNGIEAKGYDYYLIEANHGREEIRERMKRKQMAGIYSHEAAAMKNHMSRETADDWLAENASVNSVIYYMHEHREDGKKNKGEYHADS